MYVFELGGWTILKDIMSSYHGILVVFADKKHWYLAIININDFNVNFMIINLNNL